jgi:Bifunctional DNA primase/polymerase, N-terminal/AAA domain
MMSAIYSETVQKSTILDHALHYAEKMGWAVFPAPPGTKAGYSDLGYENTNRKWGQSKDATEIRRMFAMHSEANVGIPTGAVNGFFALDVDTVDGHNKDGFASLEALEAQRGILPDTLQAESPSGSRHYLFKHPPGVRIANSAGKVAPGIDIRGDGGMIVAPPSIKPAAGEYRWRNTLTIADAPAWLVEIVSSVEKPDAIKTGIARTAPVGLRPPDGVQAARVLETACWNVAAAEAGRNETLNTQSFIVGHYVGNGEIGFDVATHDLLGACDENGLLHDDGQQQCLATIKSGLNAGAKEPAQTAADMFGPIVHLAPELTPPLAPIVLPAPPPLALEAPQPFLWRDPRTIPMMPWLYGRHLLRGCVSLTVAPSGVGKTFVKIMETVALVTGRMLLHDQPDGKLRCWFYNGEEPMEILERRFQAAFLRHKLTPEQIGDRLFVNDRMTKMVIAKQTRDGVTIVEPIKYALTAYIRHNRIDVLSIDPFVSAHAVTENDNIAIDQVVKAYADVAQETNCAIDLVHHSRKTNGAAVGIEDARGASAAIGAVRAARTLNFMSTDEAKAAGVENRYRYVRIDDAKPNHAPRSEKAQWVQFEGVYLGNGPGVSAGDNVAAMTRWQWPDAMAGITNDHLPAVWEAVGAGNWRESSQATDWVGRPVATALGLNLDKPADKAKVKGMIRRWLLSGELVEVTGLDDQRRKKSFVEVGKAHGSTLSAPPPTAATR